MVGKNGFTRIGSNGRGSGHLGESCRNGFVTPDSRVVGDGLECQRTGPPRLT